MIAVVTHRRLTLLAAMLLVVQTGCTVTGHEELAAVRGEAAPVVPFQRALKEEYLALAAAEVGAQDPFDAHLFLGKAQRAGRGEAVEPQPLVQRYIGSRDAEQALARARGELLAMVTTQVLRRAPGELARAQAQFDCWLEKQEEYLEPAQVAACRAGFREALAEARRKAALGQDLFVVIAGDDGQVGAITVTAGERQLVLDQALAAAHVRVDAGLEAVAVGAEEVDELFAGALAAKPLPPKSFSLYFITDSLELTAESRPVLDQVYRDIARRPVAEVTVIGHTDRVGRGAYNDALSRKRAEEVRDFLVGKGIHPDMITTAGRGEREPLMPTADGVDEPRNRRAEISVR